MNWSNVAVGLGRVMEILVALTDQPLRDEAQHAPIRYPVSVYTVIPRALSTECVHLFDKPWEIPSCPTP